MCAKGGAIHMFLGIENESLHVFNDSILMSLPCWGDKSTQQKDIMRAQEILKDLPWK